MVDLKNCCWDCWTGTLQHWSFSLLIPVTVIICITLSLQHCQSSVGYSASDLLLRLQQGCPQDVKSKTKTRPRQSTFKTETRPRCWTLKTKIRPRCSIFSNSRDHLETETFKTETTSLAYNVTTFLSSVWTPDNWVICWRLSCNVSLMRALNSVMAAMLAARWSISSSIFLKSFFICVTTATTQSNTTARTHC